MRWTYPHWYDMRCVPVDPVKTKHKDDNTMKNLLNVEYDIAHDLFTSRFPHDMVTIMEAAGYIHRQLLEICNDYGDAMLISAMASYMLSQQISEQDDDDDNRKQRKEESHRIMQELHEIIFRSDLKVKFEYKNKEGKDEEETK